MAFVLGIIPARGGSKGIPNKNITKLRGKPLIAHTIAAAQGSQGLNDFTLSTDSKTIANCAAEYGLRISSLRPTDLATDTATNIDTVIYEVKKYEQEHKLIVEVVVLLQPTAPMRTSADIDKALKMFFHSRTDALISVYEASFVHPSIMYYFDHEKLSPVLEEGKSLKRRQEFKPVYVRNGAIYISTRSQIFEKKSFINEHPMAYVMPRERSVNIDEPYDLELAEWNMSSYDL